MQVERDPAKPTILTTFIPVPILLFKLILLHLLLRSPSSCDFLSRLFRAEYLLDFSFFEDLDYDMMFSLA